jgi:hypothetical protein
MSTVESSPNLGVQVDDEVRSNHHRWTAEFLGLEVNRAQNLE